MKIFVLNPSFGENFVRSARWAAKSRGRVQRHPDYLLIATQILLNNKHDVQFCDAAALNLMTEETVEKIKQSGPDLVIIYATTPSIYEDLDLAGKIKDVVSCRIVFIGQHVSAEYEDTFRLAKDRIDYIAIGEYDLTLLDLANGLAPKDIPGLCFKDNQKIIRNKDRPSLDINSLPFPAWHLIDPKWYPDAGKKYPFLTLLTARGCNNACTFCRDPQIMYGRKLRNRDAKLVVDEMEYDLNVHPSIREIMFETDTFAADSDHAIDICHEILKRNIHQKICWSCNARVNIDLDILPLMKKAGCRMLMVGFEFGTDEALKSVKKGGVSIDISRKFAQRAHDLGFVIHGCFMIGAPGETQESARATVDFAKKLPLDTVQFTGIATYPGTEMYRQAKKNGWLIPGNWREWLSPEREQQTLLNYPQLSRQEIDQWIDIGLKEFYLRPGQILRMLTSIRDRGDLLRKIYGLRSFCHYFLSKKNP